MHDYLPFYGTNDKELFAIERYAMDYDGLVIKYLDDHLPYGRVLDIGAGNGYTANQLCKNRNITCLEPSDGLPDFSLGVNWVKATAETMPFHAQYFDGAYSTWAYFLPGVKKEKGLSAALKAIRKGGKLIVIDNAGNDEFCGLTDKAIATDKDFYINNGFTFDVLSTTFTFKTIEDAQKLMVFYFGADAMKTKIKLSYQYSVIAYLKTVE